MSMLLMVKAMQTKVGNPLRKLVLLKLADNANDQGECWPSLQYIADQCEISKRSVISHISSLCDSGLLKKEHREGKFKANASNLYTLYLDGESPALGGANNSLGGESPALPPSESHAPRTSHSLEPVNKEIKDLAQSDKIAHSPSEFVGSGFFLILKDGKKFELSEDQIRSWCSAYKSINVNSEIAAMVEWCKANSSKRKTRAGILRFCNAWLSRADKQPKRQDWDAAARDTTWADDLGECF